MTIFVAEFERLVEIDGFDLVERSMRHPIKGGIIHRVPNIRRGMAIHPPLLILMQRDGGVIGRLPRPITTYVFWSIGRCSSLCLVGKSLRHGAEVIKRTRFPPAQKSYRLYGFAIWADTKDWHSKR